MNNYWKDYFKHYPSSTIQDFIKYLYQSILGSGHLVSDREENYRRLLLEHDQLNYDPTHPLFEDISDTFVRVHLEALTKEDLSFMHPLFMKTMEVSAPKEALLKAFEEVEKAICLGEIPFDLTQWNKEIEAYKEKGCPVLSHSEAFRLTYHPHYRLIKKAYLPYLDLFKKIESLNKKSVIAIDGHSGSGKSTLAKLIQEVYDYPIIHMDDFFLQPYQRTKERLNEIGGNLDYERFNKVVISCLNEDEFTYSIFDCSKMQLDGTCTVSFKDKLIIEGSYSHHPYFKDYASLKIFVDIDEKTQQERILKRNGKTMLERFVKEWIPKENTYFSHYQIKENSDIQM